MKEFKLSPNLPDGRFLQLRKKEKRPIAEGWTTNPPKLERLQAEKYLQAGYNIGFILGSGYIAIDCDSPELETIVENNLPTDTYIQKSARRGLKHFFYFVKDISKIQNLDKKITLFIEGKEKAIGEYLAKGEQIVLSPSTFEEKQYTIFSDLPIKEIAAQELLSFICLFNNKPEREDKPKTALGSDVDSLSITSVVSLSGLKQNSKGQYYGSNPWHGSDTGLNFWITPSKNLAYCFRCGCAISPIKAIALNEGLIKSCGEYLRGSTFLEAVKIARTKYNLNTVETPKQKAQLQNQTTYSIKANDTDKIIPLPIVWAKDFIKVKDHKPKYLIEPFIEEGSISCVFSMPKNFKSLLCESMGTYIAAGVPWLNRYKTKQTGVIHLIGEDKDTTPRRRLRMIAKGINISIAKRKIDNFPYAFIQRVNCETFTFDFIERLKQTITDNKIGLVIFDTLSIFFNEGVKSNDADSIVLVFKKLFDVVDKTGAALLLIYHSNKREKDPLGTIKLEASCDVIYRLDSKKDRLELGCYSSRDVKKGFAFTVERNNPKGYTKFNFVEELNGTIWEKEGEDNTNKKEKCKEIILQLLSKDELAHGEIISGVKKEFKVSDKTVKDALGELYNQKTVRKKHKGRYYVKQKKD